LRLRIRPVAEPGEGQSAWLAPEHTLAQLQKATACGAWDLRAVAPAARIRDARNRGRP